MEASASTTVALTLVRHGQSTWNVERRWQGTADPPLTALGRQQAAMAAAALAKIGPFHGLWSSDLQRAARTAQLISARLGIPLSIEIGLREAPFGPWQGLTRDEIEAGWPGALDAHLRPPGAESAEDGARRARTALVSIARRSAPGQRVVVVTHAGLLRMLRLSFGFRDRLYPNLTGYQIEVDRVSGTIIWGPALSLGGQPAPESLTAAEPAVPAEVPL